MATVHHKCPICGKTSETIKEIAVANKVFRKLSCKHTQILNANDSSLTKTVYDEIVSSDGRHCFPFQVESIQFMEKAGFRGLFADEPGLGKTVEVLGLVKLHQDELCPALLVCKAKLKRQLALETIRWTNIIPQIIENKHQKPLTKGITIISYDMLWRMPWTDETWGRFRTLVLDECQHMKNPSSKRTKKLRELTSGDESTIKYIIGSSGTPAKNNPIELFTFFNMIRPDLFPTETGFILKYVDTYEDKRTGARKYGGIRRDAMPLWDAITNKFMIRHRRTDVLPDLPKVQRQIRYCDLAEEVEAAYAQEMQGYMDEYDDGKAIDFKKYSNLLAYITRMRHLVGLSKIDDTIDELDEVLLGTEEKVVVFSHHIDVAEILMRKLMVRMEQGGFAEPLWFQGGMTDEAAEQVIKTFVSGPHRVLIASALASGEGVDRLQKVCKRCIMHERQWNPANEEQCEGRFTRIDSLAKEGEAVLAKYMVAVGTIDEWFTELVDIKRANMSSAMDKDVNAIQAINEQSLTREMMDIIAREGKKRWRLK